MFEIGQMVVCVDDKASNIGFLPGRASPWDNLLEKGRIYTVRDILSNYRGDICLRLHEIPCRASGTDHPFRATRFRPIRKTDISALLEAVNRAPGKVSA